MGHSFSLCNYCHPEINPKQNSYSSDICLNESHSFEFSYQVKALTCQKIKNFFLCFQSLFAFIFHKCPLEAFSKKLVCSLLDWIL